ncbi:TPA: hypothetical protein ODO73_002855, partial [Escherichia coli]|nr:hypothetical protein [Escherichia coli]
RIPPTKDASFFGYYDRTCWHKDGNLVLLNKIRNGKMIICIWDLTKDSIIEVSETLTWNWQQGALATWLNTDFPAFIFNSLENNKLVSKVFMFDKGKWIYKETHPYPVQSVSSNLLMSSINYITLQKLRPDYGYDVEANNFKYPTDIEADGLFIYDLVENKLLFLITLKEIIELNFTNSMNSAKHKINHVIFSPNGENLIFMHRWITKNGKFSRLILLNLITKTMKIIFDNRMVSHYQWRNDKQFVAWARSEQFGDKYHLVDIENNEIKILPHDSNINNFGDGHPSFNNEGSMIITDTYPGRDRMRSLLLFDMSTSKLTKIGDFLSPWAFNSVGRCDLHPRWSPDGKKVAIDSAHSGQRQLILIEIDKK